MGSFVFWIGFGRGLDWEGLLVGLLWRGLGRIGRDWHGGNWEGLRRICWNRWVYGRDWVGFDEFMR